MTKVSIATIFPAGVEESVQETPRHETLVSEQINVKKIMINVSGHSFVTTSTTLLKYPTTKLGQLVKQQPSVTNYFFESDADIFKEILKFYRNEELHCPKNVCYSDFLSHLEFWKIDTKYISECCVQEVKEEDELEKQFKFFNRRIQPKSEESKRESKSYLVWCFLADPYGPDTRCRTGSKIWAVCYLLFTIFSGTQSALATMPAFWNYPESNSTEPPTFPKINYNTSCQGYEEMWLSLIPDIFGYLNLFSFVVYGIEIWTRFITCPDKIRFWKSINGIDMIISLTETICYGFALFGIFVVVPNPDKYNNSSFWCVSSFCAQMVIVGIIQMRYLRLLSYASVYSGLKILLITLYRSWKEILLLVTLLTMSVLIFGPLIYFTAVTTSDQKEAIRSVPAAYWFVIVTMTTVGYGDMYPTTFAGYLITMVVMIVGLTITALPIAIVGGNFAVVHEYNQKREKRMLKTKKEDDNSLESSSIQSSIPSLKRKHP